MLSVVMLVVVVAPFSQILDFAEKVVDASPPPPNGPPRSGRETHAGALTRSAPKVRSHSFQLCHTI
jgi:hypothetical protein